MDARRIELLQQMAIFGGVRSDVLEFLLGCCQIVRVDEDDYYFREHQNGESMFVLESGTVAVAKQHNGRDYVLGTLKAGDCFGEMAVIDHCSRSASVYALEASAAIEITAANLYRLYAHDLKQFALIQMNMGREVCRRLRQANEMLFNRRTEFLPESGEGTADRAWV